MLTDVFFRFDGKDYTTSAYLVISLRVIGGLATGVVFPAMQNLWSKWAPVYERSKLNVFTSSGTMVSDSADTENGYEEPNKILTS